MAISTSSGDNDGMMSEINVTPLVDVMLVLLVVFIVTAPLMAPQAVKINLPKTESLPKEDKPTALRLVIDAQGKILLNEKPVDEAGLREVFIREAGNPEAQLQIDADEQVPYGKVAAVMALAQKSGVKKLAFTSLGK